MDDTLRDKVQAELQQLSDIAQADGPIVLNQWNGVKLLLLVLAGLHQQITELEAEVISLRRDHDRRDPYA